MRASPLNSLNLNTQIRKRTGGNNSFKMASFAYLAYLPGFCCGAISKHANRQRTILDLDSLLSAILSKIELCGTKIELCGTKRLKRTTTDDRRRYGGGDDGGNGGDGDNDDGGNDDGDDVDSGNDVNDGDGRRRWQQRRRHQRRWRWGGA